MGFNFSLEPINKITKIVTSQAGCANSLFISIADKQEIVERLKARQGELKKALGIKNKSQLKNRKYYRNHTGQNYNTDKELFHELLENGLQIKEMIDILTEAKNSGRKLITNMPKL